jgi:hypothetical protein
MQTFTTGSNPAYDPPHNGVERPWLLLVLGLLVMALVSVALRPVCLIDVPGTPEPTSGVRHVKRDGTWYHCEPWIRRTLSD